MHPRGVKLNVAHEILKFDPTTHHNVCPMRGTDEGDYRLRVGEYRAIFELHDTPEGGIQLIIFVTAIGSRGDIYG